MYDDSGCHILSCNDKVREISKIGKQYNFKISEEEAITGILKFNGTNDQGNSLIYEIVKDISAGNNEVYSKLAIILKDCPYIDLDLTERANGWTPLHLAATSGLQRVISSLIKHGADLFRLDTNGNLPLSLALNARNDAEDRTYETIKRELLKAMEEQCNTTYLHDYDINQADTSLLPKETYNYLKKKLPDSFIKILTLIAKNNQLSPQEDYDSSTSEVEGIMDLIEPTEYVHNVITGESNIFSDSA